MAFMISALIAKAQCRVASRLSGTVDLAHRMQLTSERARTPAPTMFALRLTQRDVDCIFPRIVWKAVEMEAADELGEQAG